MNTNSYMKAQRCQPRDNSQAERASEATGFCHQLLRCLRNSLLLAAFAILLPAAASARYLFNWVSRTGPAFSASFSVADEAIADGVITGTEILSPPGFAASAYAGGFTSLLPGSALKVDPGTGEVVASAYGLTSTNASDTLVLSATAYTIATSPTQPHGQGNWRVTHLAEAPFRITFLELSKSQTQLLVTSGSNITFSLQTSPDLVHWTPILTNVTVDGAGVVTDPDPASADVRFYRAVIVP